MSMVACAYSPCGAAFSARPGKQFCSRRCKERAKAKHLARAGHRHGVKRSPTWTTWYGMVQRCTYPGAVNWRYYGGRGIGVCARWREPGGQGFRNFIADMGEKPEGLTLDRIDPNRDYEPSNCRWATWHEQRLSRRDCLPA
jgi:hypothetical protein